MLAGVNLITTCVSVCEVVALSCIVNIVSCLHAFEMSARAAASSCLTTA